MGFFYIKLTKSLKPVTMRDAVSRQPIYTTCYSMCNNIVCLPFTIFIVLAMW